MKKVSRAEYEGALKQLSAALVPYPVEDAESLAHYVEAISTYEAQNGLGQRTARAAIQSRMAQLGLSYYQVAPIFGSSDQARKVLAGTEPLTLLMIQSLIGRLAISVDVLIQTSSKAA
jgi:antitoxin component HigA of HigAB toxin-antitoxin module